jgi:hypothetical protein
MRFTRRSRALSLALAALALSACGPTSFREWRDVRVPEALAKGDEESLRDAATAEVELSRQQDQATYMMGELLSTGSSQERDRPFRPRAEVRWDVVARLLAVAPDSVWPLVGRYGRAVEGISYRFRADPAASGGSDRFFAAELATISKVCASCGELWAQRVNIFELLKVSREGRAMTLKFALERAGRHRSKVCTASERGLGLLDVAGSPEMVAVLQQCGARRHSEEEREEIRAEYREQLIEQEARRKEEEREGREFEANRARESDERVRRQTDEARRLQNEYNQQGLRAAGAPAGSGSTGSEAGSTSSDGAPAGGSASAAGPGDSCGYAECSAGCWALRKGLGTSEGHRAEAECMATKCAAARRCRDEKAARGRDAAKEGSSGGVAK